MMLEDEAKKFSKATKDAVGEGSRRGKRGFVYFITSDKVIQAVMTASAFAVIASAIENVAYVVRIFTGFPTQPITLVSMVIVFYGAMWADNNTENWRSMVEQVTGEEPAED